MFCVPVCFAMKTFQSVRHYAFMFLNEIKSFTDKFLQINILIQMDLCCESCMCLAGQPGGWPCMAEIDFSTNFFIPAVLIGTIDFYHFYTTLADLHLALGSQGQCKAKHLGFIFSHCFKLIGTIFDVVLKQFKLNILILLLNDIYWKKENNCYFTEYIKKP